MEIYEYVLIYLLIVNVYTFYLMYSDKKKAREHKYRIPEKTLFMWALLGGSPGSMLGMHIWRHKTKHLSFRLGMPLILILQIVVALILLFQ